MHGFDYGAGADLFTSNFKKSRRGSVGYQRFAKAADAIRFAVESLPGNALAGASLEVGDDRFNAADIRRLYDAAAYPLDRRQPHGEHPPEQRIEQGNVSAAAKRPLWWSRS
jgi:hypothetical protein